MCRKRCAGQRGGLCILFGGSFADAFTVRICKDYFLTICRKVLPCWDGKDEAASPRMLTPILHAPHAAHAAGGGGFRQACHHHHYNSSCCWGCWKGQGGREAGMACSFMCKPWRKKCARCTSFAFFPPWAVFLDAKAVVGLAKT